MKTISIVTPCFNEAANVAEFYREVKNILLRFTHYQHEIIFIDNASEDETVAILKQLAQQDSCVKIIVNARNFGHIRSPYHGMLQARGDAVILIASDLQDPPALIKSFIEKWEQGYSIAIGFKPKSEE